MKPSPMRTRADTAAERKRLAYAAWLAALLAILPVQGNAQTHDQFGAAYPKECQGNLDHVKAPIIRLESLSGMIAGKGEVIGAWLPHDGHGIIFIKRDLGKYDFADVLRHERCHALMYELTGNGQWHN